MLCEPLLRVATGAAEAVPLPLLVPWAPLVRVATARPSPGAVGRMVSPAGGTSCVRVAGDEERRRTVRAPHARAVLVTDHVDRSSDHLGADLDRRVACRQCRTRRSGRRPQCERGETAGERRHRDRHDARVFPSHCLRLRVVGCRDCAGCRVMGRTSKGKDSAKPTFFLARASDLFTRGEQAALHEASTAIRSCSSAAGWLPSAALRRSAAPATTARSRWCARSRARPTIARRCRRSCWWDRPTARRSPIGRLRGMSRTRSTCCSALAPRRWHPPSDGCRCPPVPPCATRAC